MDLPRNTSAAQFKMSTMYTTKIYTSFMLEKLKPTGKDGIHSTTLWKTRVRVH